MTEEERREKRICSLLLGCGSSDGAAASQSQQS